MYMLSELIILLQGHTENRFQTRFYFTLFPTIAKYSTCYLQQNDLIKWDFSVVLCLNSTSFFNIAIDWNINTSKFDVD
jgi:hypothetical protein